MIRIPFPIDGDAYTVSGHRIASPAARYASTYYFANRRSPAEGFAGLVRDGRMIFYGLSDYINYLKTQLPITHADIDEAKAFMESAHSFGGPLAFPEAMWRDVVDLCGGMPPLTIKALPEGSTFWINEPVVEVSATGGFGEIAAMVEANLVGMVSNATARATATRHLLERVREVVRKYNVELTADAVDNLARFMVHDFGQRASSNPYESLMFGRAHMLSFHGTDSFNAAYQAWKMGATRPTGTSILALAHRIVQGYDQENEAYETLFEATTQEETFPSIGSYVADCYDFKNAVRSFLVAIAERRDAIVVARPDSGDYIENTLFVVKEAMKAKLYEVDSQGRIIMNWLRVLNGDSMNWEKMQALFNKLEENGINPTGVGGFGIGGWLRNIANRDVLSSAYKLSACGAHDTPVVKLSGTLAKMSVPGPTVLARRAYIDNSPSVFLKGSVQARDHQEYRVNYYEPDIGFTDQCKESFALQSKRAIEQFDHYEYAANRTKILSSALRDIQDRERRKHGLG